MPNSPRNDRVAPPPASALPGEARVLEAAERSLEDGPRGMRGVWPFLGPAFIASVAYIDPGNFATNVASGAKYGYMLLWVVLVSNLMAMLIQSMSAKLGIATGLNLPEACRDRFPRKVTIMLWIQAEFVAIATDLAEVIGAALGLNLLFGIDLLPASLIAGAFSFGILALQTKGGFRKMEAVIVGFVGIIIVGFIVQLFAADPSAPDVVRGLLTPQFAGSESVMLAVGILGATVMPHVIYLHSALTQHRIPTANDEQRLRLFRFERVDVVIAMIIAGMVNISMVVMAAGFFHSRGMTDVADIDQVYDGLKSLADGHAHTFFGIALLASGLSSTSVGTLAGQVVMQGFIRRYVPVFVRRAITLVPAIVIVAIGVNPSAALVLSQVVLSFGIPFALIPLVILCRDRALMGVLVNRRATNVAAYIVTALIVGLNVFLLQQTLFA
ncbi:MAG TPA: Nramp family divalent metal transporter [Miltoncostaeales bacterium]|nr:Nramp family divalent metal transporter [Miltoncostaeales bacterium]